MYRKDILAGQGHHDAGQADLAAGRRRSPPRLDGAKPGMKGICLRGLPGWGEVMAPLTTVVQHLRRHLVRQGLERAS